ncbi:hypothetical protein CHS0354_020082 [Potamilus streckersoni]|uniref:Uncharacterized protein n=1 Tax=Potamilus streckersoni TaxID=2493646 RepID=A0AAE0SC89_9BIVA|nr:hypothetical protein CHS0354_020082 [Potamilus streckersoni]
MVKSEDFRRSRDNNSRPVSGEYMFGVFSDVDRLFVIHDGERRRLSSQLLAGHRCGFGHRCVLGHRCGLGQFDFRVVTSISAMNALLLTLKPLAIEALGLTPFFTTVSPGFPQSFRKRASP